ncbi:hypothetical protein [Chryseobacterium nepalense]|uniref:hypothetical protein n=1 Tax=Chryseobacterium nepalense TaxID=1854498 RepID=UPI002DFCAFC7|nr:hypothetical protein [Chryseobacterium nepalense]
MKKFFTIIGLSILILITLTFIVIPFLLIGYLGYDYSWLLYYGAYMIIGGILFILRYELRNKFFNIFVDIFLFPVYLFFIILIVIYPIVKFIFNYLVSFILSFAIVKSIIFIITNIIHLKLADELNYYLQITITVFIVTLLSKKFKKLTNLILSLLGKSKDSKNILIDSMDVEKEKFVIYSVYLILLFIVNIFKFQKSSILENADFDTALLQSFVTFIAFDKVQTMYKQLKINPWKILLSYLDEVKDFMSATNGNESINESDLNKNPRT